MKQMTLAWLFTTPIPLPLTKAIEKLGPAWIERDCEYQNDSIVGRLTKCAWARIFKFGLRCFVVNLTVEVERDTDLEAMVAEAKEKLFREVFPLLGAQEIKECTPEED